VICQPVAKPSIYYGTVRLVTACTRARHLSLSWAVSIQPTSLISILIISSLLQLGLSSGFFPSVFPTKTLYEPLLCPCAPHPSLRSFLLVSLSNVWWGLQFFQFFFVQSSKVSCYIVGQIPPSAQYSRTLWPCLLPTVWKAKFHTHTYTTRGKIRVLYNLNLNIF